MVFELLRNRGMIIPVCVVCVFCFPNNFISFGVVAIVCAPLTSGTWCAPVTPGPTRNRSSSSFSFLSLFCCICNWRWILSLCVWLFFIRQEKKAEKLWTCRIVFDCKRRRKFLFLGGPFFLVIDEWNGMAKGAAAAASFPPFFHLLPTRSSIFFYFVFFYSPLLLLVQREKSRVSTHTHRVDGYGTH